MAGKKKKVLPKPEKKSYAKELRARQDRGMQIIQDWTAQLALDTIAMVLNDREIMGRNTFGAKRLARVCAGFNALWHKHLLALAKHDEADYWRTKIDQAQASIFGPDYLHWQERYPYWDENDAY